MYGSTTQRDYLKAELDYRLNRVQSDLAGRRKRRALTRRRDVGDTTFGAVR